MPDTDRHRIEDIKRRLYDKDDVLLNRHREGMLHPVNHTVFQNWKEESESSTLSPSDLLMKKPKTSIFKKFFLGAIVFFLVALGFAVYTFFNGSASVSNDKIDITVLGNAFTKGGDDLPLQVEIVNHNSASLELANLLISYPSGASDSSTDMVRLPRDPIGTIKPGQSITRTINVKLFGEEKSMRNVTIDLEYHPESSNAIFTKEKSYTVTISSAPLSLSIDSPTEIASDQDVTMTVTAMLNTTLPIQEAAVQVVYPSSFIFESATPSPKIGNNVWSLDDLALDHPVTITIKGRMVGQDGDQQIVHVYAGASNPTDLSKISVVYNSLLQSLTIVKPFLETHILVNNQDLPEFAVSSDERVGTAISWANNLSTRITDAVIIAHISGNVLDKASIDPADGFYDSVNNQIIWDKNTIADLGSVEPGAHGKVSFTFKTIPLVGSPASITAPQVAIDVSIKGRQPSLGSTYTDVKNFSKKIIKVLSDLQIASSAVYTSGPLPPKAESETKYAITWTLSNSVNPVSGVVARATLPIYVLWAGSLSSKENVSYNEVTREVVWNIGGVSPNTGFRSNREASFAVVLKPSLSQVDSIPQLSKDGFISGTDSFTGTVIKSTYRAVTTLLSNDPHFVTGDEKVAR